MNSPFKFLDAYEAKDASIFFGRKKEIDALYQMIFKTRLLMVYGQSGTGKTSLIQSGLAQKFDLTDWFKIPVRRSQNINKSLVQALSKYDEEASSRENLAESIKWLYEEYLRPVYLIFDQFEELFVLGERGEQEKFYQHIKNILDANLPCKIIIAIREEFIANLSEFEKVIPELFDFRLRVEPMSDQNIEDVIEGSFKQFNIFPQHPLSPIEDAQLQDVSQNEIKKKYSPKQLAGGYQEIKKAIKEKIKKGNTAIQLPYLQVYLDMFYRTDFKRTYNKTYTTEAEQTHPLIFELNEVEELGHIDEVLEKFLDSQEHALQDQLSKKFTNVEIPEKSARRVLNAFVSSEGTKQPIRYSQQGNLFELIDNTEVLPKAFGDSPEMLGTCLQELQNARLLRVKDEEIELAHDSLAKILHDDQEIRNARITAVRIRNAYEDFQQETGSYLNATQLQAYEEIIPLLNLKSETIKFIEESKRIVKEETTKEAERKKSLIKLNRRLKGVAALAGVAAIIAFIFFGKSEVSNKKLTKANNQLRLQQKKIRDASFNWTRDVIEFNIHSGEYERALGLMDSLTLFLGNTSAANPSLEQENDSLSLLVIGRKDSCEQIRNLVSDADSWANINNEIQLLDQSMKNYNQALKLANPQPGNGDNHISRQKSQLEGKLRLEQTKWENLAKLAANSQKEKYQEQSRKIGNILNQ